MLMLQNEPPCTRDPKALGNPRAEGHSENACSPLEPLHSQQVLAQVDRQARLERDDLAALEALEDPRPHVAVVVAGEVPISLA